MRRSSRISQNKPQFKISEDSDDGDFSADESSDEKYSEFNNDSSSSTEYETTKSENEKEVVKTTKNKNKIKTNTVSGSKTSNLKTKLLNAAKQSIISKSNLDDTFIPFTSLSLPPMPLNLSSESSSDEENSKPTINKLAKNKIIKKANKSKGKLKCDFDVIEKNILAGVTINKSFDDDSDNIDIPSTSRHSFQTLNDYTKKIEETRKTVEKYEAKRKKMQAKETDVKTDKENNLDILKMLATGEGIQQSNFIDNFDSEESDKDDWEEIKGPENLPPKDGIEVTLDLVGVSKKNKKKSDVNSIIKRRLNGIRKANQILVHKVHLLCWLAHGNYINKVLNGTDVMALALSLLPSQKSFPSARTDLDYLQRIVKWYRNSMPVEHKKSSTSVDLENSLKLQIKNRSALNKKMLVYIFVCLLRSLGINCRLVISFQVAPLRPLISEMDSLSNKNVTSKKIQKPNRNTVTNTSKSNIFPSSNIKKSTVQKSSASSRSEEKKKTEGDSKSNHLKKISEKGKSLSKNKVIENNNLPKKSKLEHPKTSSQSRSKMASTSQDSCNSTTSTLKVNQVDGPNDGSNSSSSDEDTKTSPVTKHAVIDRLRRKGLIRVDYPSKSNNKNFNVKNDIVSILKNRIAQEKSLARSKLVKRNRTHKSSDDDSDYVEEAIAKNLDSDEEESRKNKKFKVKQRVKPRKQLELEAQFPRLFTGGLDVWIEVFLEAEERWISADVIKGEIHCIKKLYSRATHPVTYVVAWDNNNYIKDISQRYCTNWNTVTRKMRINRDWWYTSMKPFMGPQTVRDREEDEELLQMQLDQPLPKSVSEYKNHPLYALERHLLKSEAFYPPNPVSFGFVRKEPVYSRDCVKMLRSRDMWFKEAKVVKPGEKPYKIVSKTKYDKYTKNFVKNQPHELFGEWQTQDYIPPAAENGIVPKNEYGNVDLFKQSMLPKGTIQIKLPGLNKVARKMKIDCAPAMVGFDVHHGWTHPVFDGYVVCEEHADVLIAGYHIEKEEEEQREKEKIEKRVYDNWKRLIKGLLIRERLKKRYNFGMNSLPESAAKPESKPEEDAIIGEKRKATTQKSTSKNKKNKTF